MYLNKYDVTTLKSIFPFASKDATRYKLGYVRRVGDAWAATDGHRLAILAEPKYTDAVDALGSSAQGTYAVHPTMVAAAGDTCEIECAANTTRYHVGPGVISDTRDPGTYPDVRQVIPEGEAQIAPSNRQDLAARIRKHRLEVVYVVNNPLNGRVDFVDERPSSGDFSTFNTKYLAEGLKFLKSASDPTLRVLVKVGEWSPIMLKCQNRAMIIMPMRV